MYKKYFFFSPARPFFIKRLDPYRGELKNVASISMTCRAECAPLCAIHWYKNGRPLDDLEHLYSITQQMIGPDSG